MDTFPPVFFSLCLDKTDGNYPNAILSTGRISVFSLQVEFTESLMMTSGLFAVIVLSVSTGMSHMIVILLSLLLLVG